jgi:hypothetical protein
VTACAPAGAPCSPSGGCSRCRPGACCRVTAAAARRLARRAPPSPALRDGPARRPPRRRVGPWTSSTPR